MSSPGSITRWLSPLRAGDAAAARELWEAYFQHMVELARQRLRGMPCCAADEEDVALSAFHSFCQEARRGRFPLLTDRRRLWPLLAAITVHKSVDLIRRANRCKRGGTGQAAVSPGRTPLPGVAALDRVPGREPTPEFTLQAAEEWERLLTLLDATGDPDLRRIARWKLEGEPTPAIAARLGCVRRTIERKVQIIARLWEREMEP